MMIPKCVPWLQQLTVVLSVVLSAVLSVVLSVVLMVVLSDNCRRYQYQDRLVTTLIDVAPQTSANGAQAIRPSSPAGPPDRICAAWLHVPMSTVDPSARLATATVYVDMSNAHRTL